METEELRKLPLASASGEIKHFNKGGKHNL
jgi:hypothetical protein